MTKYPGRACGSPVVDLFITLLEMGKNGLRHLYDKRKDNFEYMQDKAASFAEKHGERLLKTKRNSISLAITMGNVLKGHNET